MSSSGTSPETDISGHILPMLWKNLLVKDISIKQNCAECKQCQQWNAQV